MKIILDIMGGDSAPSSTLVGLLEACRTWQNVGFIAVGNEEIIKKTAEEMSLSLSLPNLTLVPAPSVITMEDAPLSVVREKNDSSMALGLRLLAEGEGDAFVSAGNTGALHAGSTLIVRRIRGVRKSGIASILPLSKPLLLMDSGANLELKPEEYVQFAKMGSVYMKGLFHIENPTVGLFNNGTEPTKGPASLQEVYKLLKNADGVNFIGNIEGKDVPWGKCDVLVTDGFTGNAVLKTAEAMGSFFFEKLREIAGKNAMTKAAGLMLKPELKAVKKQVDPSEYGGAPLLGLSKPVIKAHGSSDSTAIFNAIRQAIGFVQSGVTYEIAEMIANENNPAKVAPDAVSGDSPAANGSEAKKEATANE